MAFSLPTFAWPAALPPKGVFFPYVAFVLVSAGVSYFVAEMSISVLLTLGGMAQCLAITLLWTGSFGPAGAIGISAQSLILYIMSLSLRLSSSMWLNGYLPVDATGDGLYQTVDAVTVAAATVLLGRVASANHRARLLKGPATPFELNTLWASTVRNPLVWAVPAIFALASLVHGNMNARPLFDILWTAGHFFSAAASMPQLRLSLLDGCTGGVHVQCSLMAAALGQLMVLVYMWLCRPDVTCQVWLEGFSHAVWFILAAPLAHLAIICDAVPLIFSVETF